MLSLLTMTQKYYIITYGCQMNKNDSEHLSGMMEYNGYQKADSSEDADIVILNTCAVRDKAERKVYGQLNIINHQRKSTNKDQEIWVTGCVSAYDKDKVIKTAPFVDKVFPIEEARIFPARRNDRSAWISVMYGCNNFCSYCIVPYTRGRERSRTSEDILQEIGDLDFNNYDELVLLGQNVNSYAGLYQGEAITFAQLLDLILDRYPEIKKLGFLTSHPKDISDELIAVVADNKKITRELHFPIQAGDDRILQVMNRGYLRDDYLKLVDKIRKRVPDILISTDLIVGFPGETEAEFQSTVDIVKEVKFYRVNSAAYSIRAGTKAADMEGQISEQEKKRRLNVLNDTIKKYAIVHNKAKEL